MIENKKTFCKDLSLSNQLKKLSSTNQLKKLSSTNQLKKLKILFLLNGLCNMVSLHWYNRLLLAGLVVHVATGRNSFLLLALAFVVCVFAIRILIWAIRALLFQARRLPKLACALFEKGLALVWESEALLSALLILLLGAVTMLLYYGMVIILQREVAEFILAGSVILRASFILEEWLLRPKHYQWHITRSCSVWVARFPRNVFARVTHYLVVLWWMVLVVCIYTQFITSQSLGEVSC